MPAARRLFLFVALVGLAACSSNARDGALPQPCPAIGLLERAGEQTRLRTPGGTRADAVYEARVLNPTVGPCRVETDGTGLVDVQLRVQIVRGPAGTGTDYPVTYFVAVVGPEGQVLSRQGFTVGFRIPAERTGATASEELTLRIPKATGSALGNYRIYAALQLTAEELEYNRQTGAR